MSLPTILEEILVTADERAGAADRMVDELVEQARLQSPVRSLVDALSGDGLAVIAEIKRKSPSAGAIDAELDPAAQATAYVKGGASAISVLTEPHFFGGSLEDLRAVRAAVGVPVLRKDFTRNAAQIWEARAAGADAVLLIVAALDDLKLASLVETADDIGVDAIVEAHTIEEVGRAVAAGSSIVGVNNRDLNTFSTDLSVAEGAAGSIPDEVLSIGESGVSDIAGAGRMARAGYNAILVGEALVRSDDPAALVHALRTAS